MTCWRKGYLLEKRLFVGMQIRKRRREEQRQDLIDNMEEICGIPAGRSWKNGTGPRPAEDAGAEGHGWSSRDNPSWMM